MAEALLNHLAGDRFHAESAGLEPRKLNPLAVAAMAKMNIDISQKKTQDVFDLIRRGRTYQYVVTVCDESSGERCPLFPGSRKTIHWSFEDPASFGGSDEEKLNKTIGVRDQIREKLEAWVKDVQP